MRDPGNVVGIALDPANMENLSRNALMKLTTEDPAKIPALFTLKVTFYTRSQALIIPRPCSKLFDLLVSFRTDAFCKNSDQKDRNHIERLSR